MTSGGHEVDVGGGGGGREGPKYKNNALDHMPYCSSGLHNYVSRVKTTRLDW